MINKEVIKRYCNRENCSYNIKNCCKIFNKKTVEYQNCFLQKLNKNQIEYLLEDINMNVYLKACPGSGKTEVLSIKVANVINNWKNKYSGIAVLTFTNSADKEMQERINKFIDIGNVYPHYIGTFTSWIFGYIANPFLYSYIEGNESEDKVIKLIDENSGSDFLNAYKTQYAYEYLGKINASQIYFSEKEKKVKYCGNIPKGGELLDSLICKEPWRKKELCDLKKRFNKKGFALYEDIEYLVFRMLKENNDIVKLISNRFPIIFIDECQDLSYIQLEILSILIDNGSKVQFIGDLNQSIYEFRIIDVKDIKSFLKKNKFKEMVLNENYRSNKSIVDISQYIVHEDKDIIAHGKNICEKPLKLIVYDKNDINNVIEKFLMISNNCGIKKEDCKMIVRNNSLKNEVYGIENNVKSSNNIEELAKGIFLLNEYEDIYQYKVAILTISNAIQRIFFKEEECLGKKEYFRPKSIDNIEWRKTIAKISEVLLIECKEIDFNITWKEWKDIINKIIEEKISCILKKENCSLGRIRNNKGKDVVKNDIDNKFKKNIKIDVETIHNCKGRSIESVLLFTPKSKNSDFYWTKWIENNQIEEINRLAYVAMSRAKYILCLAIQNNKDFTQDYENFLIEKGFEIIKLE